MTSGNSENAKPASPVSYWYGHQADLDAYTHIRFSEKFVSRQAMWYNDKSVKLEVQRPRFETDVVSSVPTHVVFG